MWLEMRNDIDGQRYYDKDGNIDYCDDSRNGYHMNDKARSK